MIVRAAAVAVFVSSWSAPSKLVPSPCSVSSPSFPRPNFNIRLLHSHYKCHTNPDGAGCEGFTRRNRRRSAEALRKNEDDEFVVVNFYRFVMIQDPEAEVARHLHFVKDLDLHGRVYLNEQGINAQCSGPSKDALAYVNWLREDPRFSNILVQISPAVDGHAFPKLKLRYKPSLVQLEGGVSHLPLLDPSMRAMPLSPSEWRRKLEAVEERNDKSVNQKVVLLDVRNGYEWDIGHFSGAQRPEVDCFRSTSFGMSEAEKENSDPLAMVDKENTEILMYCTGGIRCDVYSTILRQKGFQKLYTLHGGVSHYLEKEGPVEWIGNLFVFDSRLSLPSSVDKPETTTIEPGFQLARQSRKFGRCYVCASEVNYLRHRNCANLDCNLLFLCCKNCVISLRGCCCMDCTTAPRLRPVLSGHERYKKWHTYRDIHVKDQSVTEVA
uniref:Rhodanese domain-containing protein n=2 Tax=Kalanchoe fedtschenkoi TaxID=63787 RepID=A0A7N0RE20_KALFE